MSRGHGRIERMILDGVTDELTPVLEIAHEAGYDVTKTTVRQSFSRATRNLWEQDAISLQWIHEIFFVRTAGMPEVTYRQPEWDAAIERAAKLPAYDRHNIADFVLGEVKAGRWKIIDAKTGTQIDYVAAFDLPRAK